MTQLRPYYPQPVLDERFARYDAFWRGADIGRPIIIAIPWNNAPFADAGQPRCWEQTAADHLLHRAMVGVDVLPSICIANETVALASAFGGQVHYSQDGKAWIDPIITDPQQAFALVRPNPTDGLLGPSLARYRETIKLLDMVVPPQVPDMQGPLQTAAQLWNEEPFIYAMYDHPEAVHATLRVVTDLIIEVYRHLSDHYPGAELMNYPPSHLPRRFGVGMTEDFMHLVTPEQYEEFGLPYVNRISDAFGGIFIHCCGRFKQHWPVVQRIHNLRGLDTMYPYTNPQEVYEAFPNIVHSMGLDYAESHRNFKDASPDAWLEFLIERTPRNIRWQFVTEADNKQTVPRQLQIIEERWTRQ